MKVEAFISGIRENWPESLSYYQFGGCYEFAQILKFQYPQARILSDNNHVITQIGERCFDIRGEISKGRALPIQKQEEEQFLAR